MFVTSEEADKTDKKVQKLGAEVMDLLRDTMAGEMKYLIPLIDLLQPAADEKETDSLEKNRMNSQIPFRSESLKDETVSITGSATDRIMTDKSE